MNLEIFSVYDSKASAYLPPFFLPMVAQAQRIFENCANDKTHQFGANPTDYTLFHIGCFNDETAEIITHTKVSLGTAIEHVKVPDQLINEGKN